MANKQRKPKANQQNKPNFFIVGAPKCGTTSLYEYLRFHPEVYMPHNEERFWLYKEPFHFCPELINKESLIVDSEEEYLRLFDHAGDAVRIGESSALYLYSENAASRIKKFSPEAKIVIMLRNPIDFVISWHRDNIRWKHDDMISVSKALSVEPNRKSGRNLPRNSGYPSCTLYREMADFNTQVKRYLEVFDRQSVGIWLLEDLSTNPENTFLEILNFLEIDTTFKPDFQIHNEKQFFSTGQMLDSNIKQALQPYRKLLQPFVSTIMKRGYRKTISLLARPADLSKEHEQIRMQLNKEMRIPIDRLSETLDRDLSHWH